MYLRDRDCTDQHMGLYGRNLTKNDKDNPLDELLRARLRIPTGANKRLAALRWLMQSIDFINRTFTGQAFFALRETEETLIELDGRTGVDLVHALLAMKGGTRINAHGLENVPTQGPIIIASTHPIGTFDFIAHAGALLDHRPDLKVVAGREAERFLGKDLLVPVDLDRHDKVMTAKQTMDGMRAHLDAGGALVIFGSGRVPNLIDGFLVERPWRVGATRVSHETNVAVVPASADMRNSRHFYRTWRLAALLSGGNSEFGRRVASLRYVSELMAKLGGTYDVHYGPAQPPGTDPQTLKELAEGLVPGLYRP